MRSGNRTLSSERRCGAPSERWLSSVMGQLDNRIGHKQSELVNGYVKPSCRYQIVKTVNLGGRYFLKHSNRQQTIWDALNPKCEVKCQKNKNLTPFFLKFSELLSHFLIAIEQLNLYDILYIWYRIDICILLSWKCLFITFDFQLSKNYFFSS